VPLCRRCHRAYDAGTLDLLPHLEPRFRSEVAHAVLRLGLARAVRRLGGRAGYDYGLASPAPGAETISLVDKEQPMRNAHDSRQAALPRDDSRIEMMRRVKRMSLEERVDLFERLSRDAAWARSAKRVR
jgi:hypothetical protein